MSAGRGSPLGLWAGEWRAAGDGERLGWLSWWPLLLPCVAGILFVALLLVALNGVDEIVRKNAAATPTMTATLTDRECIALAAFTEARSEGIVGMAAVADVVRNRSIIEARGSCTVVFEPNQFLGVSGWTVQRADHTDIASWNAALVIADFAIAGNELVPTQCRGALYFNQQAGPSKRALCRIGVHQFFKEPF